jgi:hypothetical protein
MSDEVLALLRDAEAAMGNLINCCEWEWGEGSCWKEEITLEAIRAFIQKAAPSETGAASSAEMP